MGVVSALGTGIPATLQTLYADKPRLLALPTCLQTQLALPVFEVPNLRRQPNQPGGISLQLLHLALEEALDSAKLDRNRLKSLRVGVAIGTTTACQLNNVPFYAALRAGEKPDPTPFLHFLTGNPAELIHRELDLHGPQITVSNACASGADAIGLAHLWLQQNLCDLAICGGTDELNKIPLDGFNALGICSPEPCRPFDAARRGLNLGEGAGVLILARPEFTKEAGTTFTVNGFGKTADAFHITQPAPDGLELEKAIRQALAQADLSTEELGFINAHGTGTQANDLTEATVFARLFPNGIPYMSTKALTGHTLGAAGAIEAIFTLLMLGEQKAARSHRFETLPPDIPFPPLRENLPLRNQRFALSTSLAFGGSNTALVLGIQ
jgi:3-oxoacyl-(acyl-carrier-protein) synthase